LNAFADELQRLFAGFGEMEALVGGRGRHLRLTLDGAGPHAVALCHYDTVWSTGTLERIPFSVDPDGVARGPGCFDMKGGIVVLYFALQALRVRGLRPKRRLHVLFTSDEEIGSPTSRAVIESTARGASVAYGSNRRAGRHAEAGRKGTGDYFVRIKGRAAHAGVEPQKGISATQEMAHQILTLHALNDFAVGTTINVGVVHAGTRPNVVAAEAEAHVDVRVETLAEAARIEAAIRRLQPRLPGAVLEIEGGMNRPPMERSPAMAALFGQARELATAMGVDLNEQHGGGSTATLPAMGVQRRWARA
jgi:glutamate carboxypeptidase